MKHQAHSAEQINRHLKLWIYLLPIIGVLPALWTLYRPQARNPASSEARELQKASRQSISLALVWISLYSLLSLGATGAESIMSFRFLYANAILTTGYFLTCITLMTRLNKKSLPIGNEAKETPSTMF